MPENSDTSGYDWIGENDVIDTPSTIDMIEDVEEVNDVPVGSEYLVFDGLDLARPDRIPPRMVRTVEVQEDSVEAPYDPFSRTPRARSPRPVRRSRVVAEPRPEPERYTPQRGDVVAITSDGGGLREGEYGIVDDVYGGICGDSTCTSCGRVTVQVMRVPSPTVSTIWQHDYLFVRNGQFQPVAPFAFNQNVRCQHQDHRASYSRGTHPHNGECVAPVLSATGIDYNYQSFLDTVIRPTWERVWAEEIAAREAERQRQIARVTSMAVGQRYLVDEGRSRFFGYVAEIVALPLAGGDPSQLVCDIYYPESASERCYASVSVSVFALGGRYHASFMGNRVPSWIRFPAAAEYSGLSTVTDREIADSSDTHDCTTRCFEYGCTARVDDADYEEEIEYAGDIPIHNYSYRPRLLFSGDGPLFMGTELELSTGYNSAGERSQHAAAKILTQSEIGHLVYLKSDGSISGYGFEACFHPMSYDFLVENWPEDLLRRLRNAGAMPHDSCGMHVHVNRSGFSDPVHAYKWIKFMYRNQSFMRRMARRDPGQWGSFERPDERAAAKWHAKGGYGAYSRYTAINCMPRDTYEVRIFASTLNRTRYLGSMGLVDASVEYTRQASTQDILRKGAWEFDKFRDYVSSFTKYRPLQKEMVRILDN
jgi:hypothetical protein